MINRKALKIGLDFHGVIDKQPEYFASFIKEALQRGYEIHIITGGPEEHVREELDKRGIGYTHIFAIMDHYKGCAEVSHYENGEYHIEEKVWNQAKAEYCRCQKIDLHIDDSKIYVEWFTTPYCHYEDKSHQCIAKHCGIIRFDRPVMSVLDDIEASF